VKTRSLNRIWAHNLALDGLGGRRARQPIENETQESVGMAGLEKIVLN